MWTQDGVLSSSWPNSTPNMGPTCLNKGVQCPHTAPIRPNMQLTRAQHGPLRLTQLGLTWQLALRKIFTSRKNTRTAQDTGCVCVIGSAHAKCAMSFKLRQTTCRMFVHEHIHWLLCFTIYQTIRYLSYLHVYLSNYPSICLCMYVSIFVYVTANLFYHLSVCLSIHLSTYLSINRSTYPSICRSVWATFKPAANALVHFLH